MSNASSCPNCIAMLSSRDLTLKNGQARLKGPSKINFTIPNVGKFAALGSPVGGATGVLYARRSADGIFTGGRTESGRA